MRGSVIHNLTLVAPLENLARSLGATVQREHRVVTPSVDGYVDLLVIHQSRRIVIEAERSLDRVRWDIIKAVALRADQLLIVFPTTRLVRVAQKRADEAKAFWKLQNIEIFCLTVGAALQQFTDNKPFEVNLYVPTTSIQQNAPRNAKTSKVTSVERSTHP